MNSRQAVPAKAVVLLLALLLNLAVVSQAVADGLEDAMRRGSLLVGVKTDFPPFGYMDRAGTIQGFDVEIARVLAPGGTASISVYYRNALLRMWPLLSPVGRLVHRLGGGLKGRGREHIYAVRDADEIVRTYDGAENPVGKSYTRRQFVALLEPHFVVKETFLHFFPARTLPFALPRAVHRWLDRRAGFLIYASVRRR